MDSLATLLEIVVVMSAFALPIVAAIRWLAGEGTDLAADDSRAIGPGWPRGVQEEDPPPHWDFSVAPRAAAARGRLSGTELKAAPRGRTVRAG